MATSEHGAVASEYALLATLIALLIITAATLLGLNLNAIYSLIAGSF